MQLSQSNLDNLPTNDEDNLNLWQSILHDVQKHGNPKLSPHKQIVVLGDNESGKTTMVYVRYDN